MCRLADELDAKGFSQRISEALDAVADGTRNRCGESAECWDVDSNRESGVVFDSRRSEGKALLIIIRLRASEFIQREQRFPQYVSLCRADIEKLWVGLGEKEEGFKPDDYVKVLGGWVKIQLVQELPEGMVVVS